MSATAEDRLAELAAADAYAATINDRYRESLERRNAILTALRALGIGATHLVRVLSETRLAPLNRITVARMLSDGDGQPTDRLLGVRFVDGEVHPEQRWRLRAAQALVDQDHTAWSRAVSERDGIIAAAAADGIGATAMARVTGLAPKTVQGIINRWRAGQRQAARIDGEIRGA